MICLFTMHRIEGGIGQNTHNVIVLTHRTLAPQLILGWIQSVSVKYTYDRNMIFPHLFRYAMCNCMRP